MNEQCPLQIWLDGQDPPMKAYQLADLIGVSRQTIYSLLVRDRSPDLKTLRKIEDATEGKVSMRALADWTDEP